MGSCQHCQRPAKVVVTHPTTYQVTERACNACFVYHHNKNEER